MHLLKVYLVVWNPNCFISTKSSTIIATQVDGQEMELFCIPSYVVQNEKTIFSGLEVTFTAFMDPLLVYRGTTPISCLIITFPAVVYYLLFNHLVLIPQNVVMNSRIPLVTGLYSH